MDDNGENDEGLWNFKDDIVEVPALNAALQVWQLWRLGGQWPLGNWLNQPLFLLVNIDAIDMVYLTWKEYRYTPDKEERPRGLASMNRTQLDIIGELDNG